MPMATISIMSHVSLTTSVFTQRDWPGRDRSKSICARTFRSDDQTRGCDKKLVSFVLHPGLEEVELGEQNWWKSLARMKMSK